MHGHPGNPGRVQGRRVGFVATVVVFATFAMLGAFTATAHGQSASRNRNAKAQDTYIAVVTRDDVFIRSGALNDYYPFGRLKKGRMVKVVGQKNMWARVPAMGNAFTELYGYVRYSKGNTNRLRIATNGRTATTISAVDILAPNLNADALPSESWKVLTKIDPNKSLKIIETFEADGEIVHKVPLPPTATGWINTAHLRKANATEVARWNAAATGKPVRTASRRPTPPRKTPVHNQPLGRNERSAPDVAGPPFQAGPVQPKPTAQQRTPRRQPTPQANRTRTPANTNTPATNTTGNRPAARTPKTQVTPLIVSPPVRTQLQIMVDDLERAYHKLREQPLDTAEVGTLKGLYLELADRSTERPTLVRFARQRAEQLQIWADLQVQKRELQKLRDRMELATAAHEATRIAIEANSDYIAVGRLSASSIFDGQRLPMLLRIQDPISNRTVAYVHPTSETETTKHDLMGRLGDLIGIVGTRAYDGTLRLNIVTPERIDTLSTADLIRPAGKPAPDMNDDPVDDGAEADAINPDISEAK